jgi:exosome complex component RRP4
MIGESKSQNLIYLICLIFLIQAEVQSLFQDGAIGIHTRNLKYGKLTTGNLITVQSALIRRMRSHFLTLPWGVEVILGMNGFVWIGKPRKAISDLDLDAIYSSTPEEVSLAEREAIIRTTSAILLLDRQFGAIDEESITGMWKRIEGIPLRELSLFKSMEY